jgi:tetratricopeptide (TPR) repeat protein
VFRDIRTKNRPRRIGHASSRVKIALGTLLLLAGPPAAAEDDAWVGRSYATALQRFAGGQADAAFELLRDIETRQIEAGKGEDLLAAERRVIGEIGERDAQALPGLILLHHDAFLRYRKGQRLRLAAHALRVVIETAASPQMRAAPPPIKRVASFALTSLAGTAVQLNPPDAAELLRRAIDLDPLDDHALLALAAVYEKYGNYGEAVGALKRCVAAAPSAEARLRLAINLRRTGDNPAAELLLAELATAPDPADDWAAILAGQELASLLGEAGRTADAVARLRQAVARHPRDGTLRMQLSFMLDKSGHPGDALAAAEDAARLVEAVGSSAPINPRVLYNRWPQHAFDAAAVAMRQGAEPQLDRLALALGSPRGTGG